MPDPLFSSVRWIAPVACRDARVEERFARTSAAGTSDDRGERRDERGAWTRSLHTPFCRAECQSERRAPSCTRAPAGVPGWRRMPCLSSGCATRSTCRCSGASPRGTTKRSGPRASNPRHARTLTDRSDGLARPSRRWCQEDIKAWRRCFEEQRALDGRPVDTRDNPLEKARQKLDPAKYDKQGRPLK